jgi:hypothetical protein
VEADEIVVVYCEGWDASSGTVVCPIPLNVARKRDEAGEPYAVLLLTGGTPRVLLEVCWRHHACVVWSFDDHLRRHAKRDLRRLAGELLLIEEITWTYPDPHTPEFHPAAPRSIGQTRIDRPDGGMLVTTEGSRCNEQIPPGKLRIPAPAFGDWTAITFMGNEQSLADAFKQPIDQQVQALLAELASASHPRPLFPPGVSPTATLVERFALPNGLPVAAFTGPVWQPPQPMQPDPRILTFDTRPRPMADPQWGHLSIEARHGGELRMPSGLLVACDPYGVAGSVPYTVGVSPGRYRVTFNVARWPDGQVRVAAAQVLIRDEPVASWEMALRPGEDPRTLRDGEAFRFGVDAGLACFVDAAATSALACLSKPDALLPAETVSDGVRTVEVDEPASGANLLAFASGWGDGGYPVWIGRTSGGAVTCFVADLCLLTG